MPSYPNLNPVTMQVAQSVAPVRTGSLPIGTVVLVGGLGVGGYFLYRHFFGKKRR